MRNLCAEFHFLFLCAPSCKLKGFQNILALNVGIVAEHILDGVAGCELAEDGANGDTGSLDAGLSAHNSRRRNNAIELVHGNSWLQAMLAAFIVP